MNDAATTICFWLDGMTSEILDSMTWSKFMLLCQLLLRYPTAQGTSLVFDLFLCLDYNLTEIQGTVLRARIQQSQCRLIPDKAGSEA